MNFDKSILREADIRGIYPHQISGEFANRLGKVFGTYIKSIGVTDCVVGHDNRFGGPHLTKNLVEGLISTGIDVIYIGLVTTPMLNFACHNLGLEYAIMVTASHNPKDDNGFKLFGENYQHCDHDVLDIIYNNLSDENYEIAEGKGHINYLDIEDKYAKYLAESINPGNKRMRAVIDCGNGTASLIIRKVYERLPFETIFLFCDSNPNFPNHHPDPNVKENLAKLAKAVKHNRADIGIAYDGDCDRAGFVDNKGNVVEADVMMALMAKDIIAKTVNKTILVDVKCSNVLLDEIKASGGEYLIETPSSAQQERIMNARNIPFGGGYSNHIFFRDRHDGYDDGIYVGLRLQEKLSQTDESLHDMVKGLKQYYNTGEIKVKTTDQKKFQIVEGVKKYCDTHNYEYSTIDGLKIFKGNSWALVRASNTGPNLTLRFESTTEHGLKSIQKEFMDVLGILER